MLEKKTIAIDRVEWVAIPTQLQDGLHNRPLSKRQLRNWTLVLQAREIPCRSERGEHGWQLLVPTEQYQLAIEELQSFEQENRNWPPPLPPEPEQQENTASTLWVLIALGLFHILTQKQVSLFGQPAVDWYQLGNAHADKILSGEWWRLTTALTLHSGGVHLASNIIVGGIFINRLCRNLGSGLGWSLVLASGVLGNLANAFVQSPAHRSIGASTAVFGAVGLLAAINMLRYRSNLRHRWPLPIAAGLGLLALLGAGGENTDIGAHLFGFGFGIVLGFLTDQLISRFGSIPPIKNRIIAAANVSFLCCCWYLALF